MPKPPDWIVPKIEILPLDRSHVAEWNPRTISKREFERLKESIKRDPQFMTHRPILRTKKGLIYAGSQRWNGLRDLGYKDGPFITTDISDKEAKRRALMDNNHFGEYQTEELAQLVHDLKIDKVEMELLALPTNLINSIIGPDEDEDEGKEDVNFQAAEKTECPNCGHKF